MIINDYYNVSFFFPKFTFYIIIQLISISIWKIKLFILYIL